MVQSQTDYFPQIRGIVEQGLGHLDISSSSSRFINKSALCLETRADFASDVKGLFLSIVPPTKFEFNLSASNCLQELCQRSKLLH